MAQVLFVHAPQPAGRWHESAPIVVDGAAAALARLRETPTAAVVCGLHLPDAEGIALLAQVREHFPHVVRMLYCDDAEAAGAAPKVAEQHLCGDYDADMLRRAILRVRSLRARDGKPAVARAQDALNRLPPLPRLYWQLMHEIDNPHSDPRSLATIIEQDVTMTAKLLHIANSAAVRGTRNEIHSVREAAMVIGMMPIRSLALSMQLQRTMSMPVALRGISLEHVQQHAWLTAQYAAAMMREAAPRERAFTAGMLHSVGQLVLAMAVPEASEAVRCEASRARLPLWRVEDVLLDCNYAEIGAQMLALWGLPTALVDAVACHHRPSLAGGAQLDVATAVHIASVLAMQALDPAEVPDEALERSHLQMLGLNEQVNVWLDGEAVRPPR